VLVALLYLQLWAGRQSSGRVIGVDIDDADGVLTIEYVNPNYAAARAGLKAKDAIVSVNGEPVRTLIDYDRQASRFERGKPIAYGIRRGSESLTVKVVPGRPFPWSSFLFDAVALFGYFGVGALAFVQRREDLRARLLFIFGIAVAFEMALPQGSLVGLPAIAIVARGLFFLVSGVQIGVELHLASVVPARQHWLDRHAWVVPAFYVVGCGIGLVVASSTVIESLAGVGVLPWSAASAARLFFDAAMPAWAFAVFGLLGFQALRYPEPRGRQQAGLVLLGVAPWVILVVWTTTVDLIGTPVPDWFDAVWAPALLLYPIAVFVAMFRYNLFDIELMVRRSMLYASLTAALVLVFYAALGAGGALLSPLFEGSRNPIWLISAATLVLGLLFSPLRDGLQRLIDKRFFPERLALRQRLIALASELAALGKLPLMGRHLIERLCEIFSVSSATVLVADPRSGVLVTLASSANDDQGSDVSLLLDPTDRSLVRLARNRKPIAVRQLIAHNSVLGQRLAFLRAELAVPLLSAGRMVGLLLLGGKANHERFVAEEVELLDLFSHHVATVFENARLFESATYEGLTGLLRREAILQELEREAERAKRYQRPLTVGMVDLDEFKEVNDRFGHLIGDMVLKRVAQAISAGLRSSDIVGRYGGDEFLFLLPETDLSGAITVADKVRSLVEAVYVALGSGERASSTVSIGLGSLDLVAGMRGSPAQALIEMADRNVFHAKSVGRNRVVPASAA
jgi:diguanylate cyclase (GGDEF)-like protein